MLNWLTRILMCIKICCTTVAPGSHSKPERQMSWFWVRSSRLGLGLSMDKWSVACPALMMSSMDLLTDRASLNIHQFNETDEHISLLILERSDKAIRHVLAILMNEIRRICCRVIVNRHKSYVAAAAADEKIILNRSLCSNESNMRYWGRWEGLVQRVSSVLIVVDYIEVLIWIEW